MPSRDDLPQFFPANLAELATRTTAPTELATPDLGEVFLWGDRHPIPPTLGRRLRRIYRLESRSPEHRIIAPSWSREGAIPGLIVAQRYDGGDAFGLARQTAELDMPLRRAAALIKMLQAGEQIDSWPRPILPHRGGLWLLDARYGSLDALWTVYGDLVTVAASTPVSLASFATLAWGTSRSALRTAHRWVVRSLKGTELAERPSASDPTPSDSRAETWQERTSKRLAPVFEQAIKEGYGVDFRAAGAGGEIRLIVTPAATQEATDDQPEGNGRDRDRRA